MNQVVIFNYVNKNKKNMKINDGYSYIKLTLCTYALIYNGKFVDKYNIDPYIKEELCENYLLNQLSVQLKFSIDKYICKQSIYVFWGKSNMKKRLEFLQSYEIAKKLSL